MPMSNLLKKNIGSTLVEALISVSVVSVGSLGLINLQGQMLQSNGNAYQNSEAMQVAQSKMEELRDYSTFSGYDAITSGSDTYTGVNSAYARSWTVTKVTDPNYATVALSVTWTRRDDTTGTINLSSRIARLDPVLSGRAMDDSSGTTPLNPGNANSEVVAEETPSEEEAPAEEETPVENDTTTITAEDGTVLVYDADNNVMSINGHDAVTISGTITEATGGNAPQSNINYANIVVSATSAGFSNYCSYGESGTDTVNYSCVFQNGFTGTINISGVSGVKLCASMSSNSYNTQLTPLTGQDYKFFKTSKSCSGSTPYQIDTL